MSDKYILNGKTPVRCNDLVKWAHWFETTDRCVAKNEIDGAKISTVFLGINHSFSDGPPLLFETMIFGGDYDSFQSRSSTWDESLQQHAYAMGLVHGMSNV